MDFLKFSALQDEFNTANKLIKLGMGELQNINNDDFYFLPFQLLSQGFERFMKAYICAGYFEKNRKLPNFQYLRGFGHDLEKLLAEIVKNYFHIYEREQFDLDNKFLTENDDLKELLFILSEFGKLARYYNFDFITDNSNIGVNPKELWIKYEIKISERKDVHFNKITDYDVCQEVYHEITNFIIIVFEKFISGISRQIIFGTLGQIGVGLTAFSFYDFGYLYEGDFGFVDYRKETTQFKETPKRIHKRTPKDEYNRRNNMNFKSKKITKNEYNGDWPFYNDEVIIECREKHWCIVTIGEFDYALNGAAKGRYKLENPHDAGMAILGKSIEPFIKMAMNL